MSKIIFPAAVIVVAASCAVVTSIHKPSTTVDINQERTSPTTSVQPLADFTNAASLCALFEDMTDIAANTMDINKKRQPTFMIVLLIIQVLILIYSQNLECCLKKMDMKKSMNSTTRIMH